jgi:hypothetical protein
MSKALVGNHESGSNLTLGTEGSGRFWAHFGRTQLCNFDRLFEIWDVCRLSQPPMQDI